MIALALKSLASVGWRLIWGAIFVVAWFYVVVFSMNFMLESIAVFLLQHL